ELAAERVLLTIRLAQHEAPASARPEVHLAGHHGVSPRAPPVAHVLACAVRLEDEAPRRVEDARELDLEIRNDRHRHRADLAGGCLRALAWRHGLLLLWRCFVVRAVGRCS